MNATATFAGPPPTNPPISNGPQANPPPATSFTALSPPATSASSFRIGPVVGGIIAGAVLCLAVLILLGVYRRKHRSSSQSDMEEGEKDEGHDAVSFSPADRQGNFTLKQLRKATGNFAANSIIGKGTFGVVYKGLLANGLVVAVKRLETRPGQKRAEGKVWKAEVEALGRVQHKNLVPLLGVCVERGEKLLVFKYFPKGSLDKQLFHQKDGERVLSWAERMNIARSICRGLIYLHNDIIPPMVHRDIKSANILLTDDDAASACIADFGLAHLVQGNTSRTSTMIKGTLPYMAPEYLHGGAKFLSPMCDVYSFGMLFLELVSGQPAVRQLDTGFVEQLEKKASDLVKDGRALELVDQTLGSHYDTQEACKYIHVALACLRRDPSSRPTMEGVGSQLTPTPLVSSLQGQDMWELEASPTNWGILRSSSETGASNPSTMLVASRFVTPR